MTLDGFSTNFEGASLAQHVGIILGVRVVRETIGVDIPDRLVPSDEDNNDGDDVDG